MQNTRVQYRGPISERATTRSCTAAPGDLRRITTTTTLVLAGSRPDTTQVSE